MNDIFGSRPDRFEKVKKKLDTSWQLYGFHHFINLAATSLTQIRNISVIPIIYNQES